MSNIISVLSIRLVVENEKFIRILGIPKLSRHCGIKEQCGKKTKVIASLDSTVHEKRFFVT
jgi:hypothetical protein